MTSRILRLLTGAAAAAALIAVLWPATPRALAEDKITEDAKAYQAQVEAMMGQAPKPVLNKLVGWKFEPMAAWMATDPNSKDFKTANKGKTKLSKKEIEEIFAAPGQYKIAVYGLLVATDSATTGSVDQFGMTSLKDASHSLQIFTAVRIVFRDDKLISVRAWPRIERSEIAGGAWRVR
ncbi:MAG TPA: hypothetical protein VLN41_00535 [Candidatus Bathyarchaeia archaeon]|nr:hypothetical protein [Candidatus Bathyarchaeia archaeon]